MEYNSDKFDTQIFPNPTSSILYWNKDSVIDEIIVYNSNGQIVSNVIKPDNNSFSLINLEKGIYYIEFFKEQKRVFTKKIIKE
jgi:hypothetical protein